MCSINHRTRRGLTLKNVGNSAKEPVKPVEDRTILAGRLATKQTDQRLCNHTQQDSYQVAQPTQTECALWWVTFG